MLDGQVKGSNRAKEPCRYVCRPGKEDLGNRCVPKGAWKKAAELAMRGGVQVGRREGRSRPWKRSAGKVGESAQGDY